MIPFNVPLLTGQESNHVLRALNSRKLSGDGEYVKKCEDWFEQKLGCRKALLTPSCTHALEMMALLIDVKPGDEIIMPSYTFTSTANAFALRGAKIVFVDVRPDTMNIDESLIESAITSKTRAIVVVHYAGVACEMDAISAVAENHGIVLLEDAAQAMMSTYQTRPLGTIGELGAFSFHETKNYTCGEGGLLIVNDPVLADRAEIIREKGTNRCQFYRGEVDKYGWVDIGSSYLNSELNAAYLYGQLQDAESVNRARLNCWNFYFSGLSDLAESGQITLPHVPASCKHNAHMFYIRMNSPCQRDEMLAHLKRHDVSAVFHYQPLHSSIAGKLHGRFHGADQFTTAESEKLLRLPLYYGLDTCDQQRVIDVLGGYFQ